MSSKGDFKDTLKGPFPYYQRGGVLVGEPEIGGNVTLTFPDKASNADPTGVKCEPGDPWKHRTEGMACKTCMWFVTKERICPQKIDIPWLGRCRRHAPTMNGYPVVFENDWCGDHKLDENKI